MGDVVRTRVGTKPQGPQPCPFDRSGHSHKKCEVNDADNIIINTIIIITTITMKITSPKNIIMRNTILLLR